MVLCYGSLSRPTLGHCLGLAFPHAYGDLTHQYLFAVGRVIPGNPEWERELREPSPAVGLWRLCRTHLRWFHLRAEEAVLFTSISYVSGSSVCLTLWQLGPALQWWAHLCSQRKPTGQGLEELTIRSCECTQQQWVHSLFAIAIKNNTDLKNKKMIVLLGAVIFNFITKWMPGSNCRTLLKKKSCFL